MTRKSINEQLRDAIEQCGKTRYRISIESKVSQSVLSRFVNGQTELSLGNAEAVCAAIGTELILKIKNRK
jgi:hypothetical protein